MPAVDTDVVVRDLAGGDAAQARAARRLVDGGDIALSCTVLPETEWVLRSLYGYDPQRIRAALTARESRSRLPSACTPLGAFAALR